MAVSVSRVRVNKTGREVDAVLFDYGGVLTGPVRDSIAAWMAADGIEPDSFSHTLRSWMSRDAAAGTPVHQLETGVLSVADFEVLFAAKLRAIDGRKIAPKGLLGRFFGGMEAEPAMFELAEDLRKTGLGVGLLSNSWGNTYPRKRIDALFDPVVISSEVGLRKPQAAIYELAVDKLGLPADRVLFIDDADANVLGARAAGLQSMLHIDHASTRAVLAELVPGLDRNLTGVNS